MCVLGLVGNLKASRLVHGLNLASRESYELRDDCGANAGRRLKVSLVHLAAAVVVRSVYCKQYHDNDWSVSAPRYAAEKMGGATGTICTTQF
jgi:hypothetical protein